MAIRKTSCVTKQILFNSDLQPHKIRIVLDLALWFIHWNIFVSLNLTGQINSSFFHINRKISNYLFQFNAYA